LKNKPNPYSPSIVISVTTVLSSYVAVNVFNSLDSAEWQTYSTLSTTLGASGGTSLSSSDPTSGTSTGGSTGGTDDSSQNSSPSSGTITPGG
jgi:hypothetical protein